MTSSPFRNEPVLELRRAPVRASLADALRSLDAELPLRAGGDAIVSVDPCHPARVVATAGIGDPDAAVGAAAAAFAKWSATPAGERAEILVRAAAVLRRDRLRCAALALRECGKPWPEADADVCEAIDFLEFYARGAIELDRSVPLLQVPGERNELRYAPRGVVAVIAPWNFPLAIPLGMAAAALATGNTVVLKPAEQAPGCALVLAEALREAGVPEGVFNLLTGEGEAGAALVKDPRVATIAFTGSNAVGLEIVREAAIVRDGQHHLKRCIIEMGGKNCVIVDSDADPDEVVPALVASAFDYAGQKCSAASRVLCHEAIHDTLVERLAGAIELLEVGPAESLSTEVPAVIEPGSVDRHRRFAAMGQVAATVAELPDRGYYAAPTLLADPDDEVLRTEVFAPLLTVEPVRSAAAACDVVDTLPFALTAGLFCRNPDTVDRVAARLPVGNLYVNRSITGAMVARQPFGGNKLSGTGTKAGGPGYLLQFVEPRVVTENTMRHGLVV